MKRYNALYPSIYSMDNLMRAHCSAQKGKRHYTEVRMVNSNPEKYLWDIHQTLQNKSFVNGSYEIFQKIEHDKKREIYRLPYYPDRIIHHAIMHVLEPIWMAVFIRDTYASIRGRGIHDGIKRLIQFLKDTSNTLYCLKFDIRKFYPSINHDILKNIIRRKIKCRDTLWLLDTIIDSAPGVPIGNYLSQYFANLYLAYFDHWVKEDLKIKYYLRYCDDIVILGRSKEMLRQIFKSIEHYLTIHLKLTVKNNWQIFPVIHRNIDFLGYCLNHNDIRVRKSIAMAFCRKADDLLKRTVHKTDANMLMSYYGWLKFAKAFGLWHKKIKPLQQIVTMAFPHETPKPIRSLT